MSTENTKTSATHIPPTAGFKTSGSLSTNTILLSRKKMGMSNLPRQESDNNFNTRGTVPPPAQQQPPTEQTTTATQPAPQVELPPAKRMTATSVWCPRCDCSFEINAELYGILAECSECGMEFKIPDKPTESTTKVQIQVPPPRTNRPGSRRPATKKHKNDKSSPAYVYISIIVVLVILLIYALFSKS